MTQELSSSACIFFGANPRVSTLLSVVALYAAVVYHTLAPWWNVCV